MLSPKISDKAIINRWLSFYGEQQVQHIQKLNAIGIADVIRVNRFRVDSLSLIKTLTKKKFVLEKSSLPLAYKIISKPKSPSLGSTHEFLFGFYSIQGLASQFVPSLFSNIIPEQDKILDMTAAPGGKTIQLADYMKNTGVIIAIESSKSRISSLRSNIARLGKRNIAVIHGQAQKIVKSLGTFNKILLDAPCSGSGSICRRPSAPWRQNVEDIYRLQEIQYDLLDQAFQALAPGGELVYSTCSLEPEEGELQIEKLIKNYPDHILLEKIKPLPEWKNVTISFHQKKAPNISKDVLNSSFRLLPGTFNEGFFISKIKRKIST